MTSSAASPNPKRPIVASTKRGRELTEAHRQDQLRIKSAFLSEFIPLFNVIDWFRIDLTTDAWLNPVMLLINLWRQQSAEATQDYYKQFRSVEVPDAAESSPTIDFVASRRGVSRPERTLRPVRSTGRLIRPRIDWGDANGAVERSLRVTGPGELKRQAAKGSNEQRARRVALVTSSASASRHVLEGGRRTAMTLIESDEPALGWIRVTDNDPCAFCAMLASRGPVYFSKESAGFQPHDGCACMPEPVFHETTSWPGRSKEFQKLWYASTKGFSGKDALNAFRRAYEQQQRPARRREVA